MGVVVVVAVVWWWRWWRWRQWRRSGGGGGGSGGGRTSRPQRVAATTRESSCGVEWDRDVVVAYTRTWTLTVARSMVWNATVSLQVCLANTCVVVVAVLVVVVVVARFWFVGWLLFKAGFFLCGRQL